MITIYLIYDNYYVTDIYKKNKIRHTVTYAQKRNQSIIRKNNNNSFFFGVKM